MKLLTCAFLLAAFAFTALADVTGTYSGSFKPEGSDESGAVMHLKQNGTEITGTAGPDEERQWAIAKGKLEGNKLTCEVQNPNGLLFRFDLTVEGERISGDVTATSPEGENRRAKMDLTKVKK